MSFLNRLTLLVCLFSLLNEIVLTRSAISAETLLDRLEASVNSNLILKSDIDRFRRTLKLRAQLDPLFSSSPIAKEGAKSTDREIIDFLIEKRLILERFPVSDAEVEQEINSVQANNHIDRTGLKRALVQQGYSFDEYFNLIRDSISTRNLIDRDIRIKVSISEDDIKNEFYNSYGKSIPIPSSYHIQVIALSLDNYKDLGSARSVADRAHRALVSGESFVEVAKRFSTDPSASQGGDLGYVTEDQMTPVIREELKKMKVGSVSPVLGNKKTHGFYIIKLVDKKSSESDKYEKIKETIRNQLSNTEYTRQIALWIDRQKQTAFIRRAGDPSFPKK